MSLLDDARRLANADPWPDDQSTCPFCGEWVGKHAEECPWLQMPQIVAALEATEAIVAPESGDIGCEAVHNEDGAYLRSDCRYCQATYDTEEPHAPDCPWQALVAALKGEGAGT